MKSLLENGGMIGVTMDFGSTESYGASVSTGLSSSLFNVSGENNAWTQQTVDISAYANCTVRLVFKYANGGSSFYGDLQLDAIDLDGNTYSFESTGESFETSASGESTYAGVSWGSLATGTTAERWNVDSGGTPSDSTGRADAADGSYYVYAETSSPANVNGYLFWLRSPEVTLGSTPTLTFYEARYGANIGQLDVYLDVVSAPAANLKNSGIWNLQAVYDRLNAATASVSYIAYSTNDFAASTDTSYDLTLPTGIQDGDMLLVLLGGDGAINNGLSGNRWSFFEDSSENSGIIYCPNSASPGGSAYAVIYDSSVSYTVRTIGSLGRGCGVISVAVRNTKTNISDAAPLSSAVGNTDTSATVTYSGNTYALNGNALAVYVAVLDDDHTTVSSWPVSGDNVLFQLETTADVNGTGGTLAICAEYRSDTGSLETGSSTLVFNTDDQNWGATFAVLGN